MKKISYFLCFIFIFAIFLIPAQVSAQETNSNAAAMCVLEKQSGRVLYSKNQNKKLPMASLTKIFTAITVLENCNDLSTKVKVNDKAVGIEGTSIYLRYGEELTVEELLYGMMLPSGNDAATALAYHIGGDIPKFCKLMQKTAQKAGAKNSNFKNPHGLDEAGHYTTAYDLSKITAEALKNQKFLEIVSTKYKKISGNNEVPVRFLRNKNKLLHSFEGCDGVKTGFTDNAGRCFVSSASRDNMSVVCTVLNCGPMFEECANLMQKAFDNYKMHNLVQPYETYQDIEVEKGKQKTVGIYSQKGFSYPLTNQEYLHINYVYEIPNKLKAPLEKEQIVGTIKVYLDDKLLFKDQILTKNGVKKEGFWQNLKDISTNW